MPHDLAGGFGTVGRTARLILGLRRGRLGRAAALVADTSISANHGFGIGGIGNTGTLTVRRSVISGNGAREGGGINNSGDAAIVDSTIEGNSGFIRPEAFSTSNLRRHARSAVLAAVALGALAVSRARRARRARAR